MRREELPDELGDELAVVAPKVEYL